MLATDTRCHRCGGLMRPDYEDRACIVCGYVEYAAMPLAKAMEEAAYYEQRTTTGRRRRGGSHAAR